MLWIVFSLLTALFESLKIVFTKKALVKMNEYLLVFGVNLFALLYIIPLLLLMGIPIIKSGFMTAIGFSLVVKLSANLLYAKALKMSDISIVTPLTTFSPMILLITAPLILGEFPPIIGQFGVVLIVIGAYVQNIKKASTGILEPFLAIVKNKGSLLMIAVATLYGISPNIDKMGVARSSPIFWLFSTTLVMMLVLLPIVILKTKRPFQRILRHWKFLLPIGMSVSLSNLLLNLALSMAYVAYVISIKRLSIIITVIFGILLFKEKGFKERTVASVLMVAGVIVISFAG